jgi:exonuclease III
MLCGDYNQEVFDFFDYWNLERQTTFPATGQHLDHILFLKKKRTHLQCTKVHFYREIELSDHIPVVYEFIPGKALV